MNYLIEILIAVGLIGVWQTVMFLLRREHKAGIEEGRNFTVMQIFNQIKQKGKINIILDGNKITLIESKIKNNH